MARSPVRATFVVLLMTLATSPARAQQSGEDAPGDPARGAVAIIPFTNVTGDAVDAWIGGGIAATLMADLQGAAAFDIVGWELIAETMAAVGLAAAGPVDEGQILDFGRRVGARWLISGGYQRLGDQIRITARLVEVPTGTVSRSAKVDGTIDELFQLQDRLAAQLIEAPPPGVVRQAPPSATASAPGRPALAPPARGATVPLGSGEPGVVAGVPAAPGTGGFAVPGLIDGPPPPVPPEVITRDARGRATMRAIRLSEGIRVDGRLDERVYQTVPPIGDFIQQVPNEGAPATEPTEAWVMFDETNLYVAGRCYDSAPPDQWVANEMRRDSQNLRANDTFGILLDTFYDRRNGLLFYTTPLGALVDMAITNEGNPNIDWNPVWDVRTARFEGGWTVEMEIPFKSLRYQPGPSQVWGVQIRRSVIRKNEWSYATAIPISAAGFGGSAGIFRVSSAGTLVGLEVPAGAKNLEIKPYGIGGVTTDVNANPPKKDEGDGDIGFDVKYGITQNLTADLTVNTDFAQVEVDEQQVNLTRFSLFFPEKREFFLEGRGIFNFARGGVGGGGGGGFGVGAAPTIFYSRRIGLERGRVVPIIAGGRLTGKVGPFDVGALSIQTDDETLAGARATNFTVVRLKRDILRRSSIGGLFTNRSVSLIGGGASQAYGADATFSFYDNVNFLGYFAKTRTPGLTGQDASYQGRFSYGADRYGVQVDHLVVEDNFVPEVGFVRRDNFRRTFVSGRFSPRPRSIDMVRQFTFDGSLEYILTADRGFLETRRNQLGFTTQFENSDQLSVSFSDNYELLEAPFTPAPGVTIPIGGYDFRDVRVSYSLGPQRRVSGQFSVQTGGYFNGDITSVDYNRGRIEVLPQFSIEPSVSLNWVDLPAGSFTTELVRSRITYTFTPRMFVSGLLQYNTRGDSLSTNLRLRWEYRPGSELFIVYTEDRDTDPLLPDRYTELRNRGFVVKINRLFRF